MYQLNTELFLYLHSLAVHSPELWMFLASWFGVIMTALAVLFVGFHKHGPSVFISFKKHLLEWRALLFIPAASWATTGFLKFLFSAPRPYLTLDITPLSMPGALDSFPSGHATFYMAVALAIYAYNKKAGIVFIVMAVILSISRIVIGVHYPLDILAGWLVAYLFYRLIKS